MKKALVLILALTLLSACGGSAGAAEKATPEPTAAPTEAPTPTPTAEPTAEPTPEPTATPDPNKVEWMGYALHIDDRQPMTGKNWPIQGASRAIDDKKLSSSANCVMLQLGCDDGVRSSDLTDDNVKQFLLTLPDGSEVRPYGYNWWGFQFDSTKGFVNNDVQDGFRLVFEIPEGTDLETLKLTVDLP